MFTISCYSFHPLLCRFVGLWRNVQWVSAWLSLVMSTACCQCAVPGEPLSECTTPEPSDVRESTTLFITEEQSSVTVDEGNVCGEPLRAQHLLVDFQKSCEDNDVAQVKCCQFWDFVRSNPQLERMVDGSLNYLKPQETIVNIEEDRNYSIPEETYPEDVERNYQIIRNIEAHAPSGVHKQNPV